MSDCPNRPEWAAPVPAISPEGYCFHCSRVSGEWVECMGGMHERGCFRYGRPRAVSRFRLPWRRAPSGETATE
jgi:hypothetical protein